MNEKLACRSYLLKCVSSQEDMAQYVRWYLETHFKNDNLKTTDPEQAKENAVQDFTIFWSSLPKNAFSASLTDLVYSGEVLTPGDYAYKVLSDDSISTARTCVKYLTRVSEALDPCCFLCSYGGSGRNNNRLTEASVLKLIASDKNHLEAFREAGGSPDFFLTHWDVFEGLNYSLPIIIPVFRYMYEAILVLPEMFYDSAESVKKRFTASRMRNLLSKPVLEAIRLSQHPNEAQFRGKYRTGIETAMANMVADAPDIDLQDMRLRLADWLSRANKEKNREIPAEDEKRVTGPQSASEEAVVKKRKSSSKPAPAAKKEPKKAPEKAKTDKKAPAAKEKPRNSEINPRENGVSEEPSPVAEDSVKDIKADEKTDASNPPASELPAEQTTPPGQEIPPESEINEVEKDSSPTPAEEIKPEKNEEKTADDSELSEDNIEALSSSEANLTEDIIADDHPSPDSEYTILLPENTNERTKAGKKDMIFLPRIPVEVLHKLVSLTSCPEEIYEYISFTRILPLEIVQDEEGAYHYLLWISKGGYFAYASVKEIHAAMILLLRQKRIVKVCWQPYLLLALSRAVGVDVENIYSIYSVDLALHPHALPCAYDNLVRQYAAALRGMPLREKEMVASLMPLYNAMPYYAEVYHGLLRDARLSKEAYRELAAFDTVLGFSYLLSLNFVTDRTSFDITPAGRVSFLPFEEIPAKRKGHLVTYAINEEDVPGFQVSDLFKGALSHLVTSRIIYKNNIQIVYMNDQVLHLFIGEKSYDFLTTVLQNWFHKWAVKNKVERFALIVSHQDISGENDSALTLPSGKRIDAGIQRKMAALIAKRSFVHADSYKAKGLFELRDRIHKSKEKVIPFGRRRK